MFRAGGLERKDRSNCGVELRILMEMQLGEPPQRIMRYRNFCRIGTAHPARAGIAIHWFASRRACSRSAGVRANRAAPSHRGLAASGR
jgi:hypothetical protein